MGSLLEGQQALHKTLSIGIIAALAISNLAPMVLAQVSDEPWHRESQMVAVDWQSTPSELEKTTNQSVAKPIVDQAVEHTVYQSPSVYLDSPANRANSNPIFDGFRKAGQNLSQATGQTLRDLGNGTKGVAQGLYNGTTDTLSAGAAAIDNTVDNTFNIGNPNYFSQRAQQNGAQQNGVQQNGVRQNGSATRLDLPPAPANRQTAGFEDDFNGQNNNPMPNNNQQLTQQQQFNQQSGQPLSETPAVPRRSLDTGISTNFGNNQASQSYQNGNSNLAPVLNAPQNGYRNDQYDGAGYTNQNQYQQNNAPNNQNGFPNQNRGNLISPPSIDQYANNTNQVPAWTTPSFNNQVANNQTNPQGYGNQGNGPQLQQTGRPVSSPNSQWPAQTVSTTGWGESSDTPQQTAQNPNPQLAQNNLNTNQVVGPSDNGKLVWILAGFSLFGNVYGWTALLEMRNKYRASLRRSPVNLRDGGH